MSLFLFVSLLQVSLFKTTFANPLLSTQLLAAGKPPAPLLRGCTAVTLHHHGPSIQARLLQFVRRASADQHLDSSGRLGSCCTDTDEVVFVLLVRR